MIRNRSKPRPRQLFLEGLESRQMLAVTATGSGIVRITGDGAENHIVVTSTGTPGEFFIEDLGASGFTKTVSRVLGFTVDLKGGNDTFSLGGNPLAEEPDFAAELLGNVSVNLGSGDNQVANLSVNTLGAVTVKGGSLTDTINIENSIMRSLSVTGSGGDDTLNILNSAFFSLTANMGVNSVRGEATDDDQVNIASSAIGTANITLGTASEYGENDVEIASTIFGSLRITGGNRADDIYIGAAAECGIGGQLDENLVSLVNDLEPLLEGFLGRVNVNLILNNLDSLLGVIAGPLDLNLEGFDFSEIWAESGEDLSDALRILLDNVDAELAEDGLSLCGIGAQTTIGILNINTAGGDDYVDIGQEEYDVYEIPTIGELLDAARDADVRILTTAIINTGDGEDDVELNNVFIGLSLSVLLGRHDDYLLANQVTVAIAILNGGAHGEEGDTLNGDSEDLGFIRRLKSLFENDYTLVT